MTLYEIVRRLLETDGPCSRAELLAKLSANPEAAERLKRSRGFSALLLNMKHSGFIELDGEIVRRTGRNVGRRHA